MTRYNYTILGAFKAEDIIIYVYPIHRFVTIHNGRIVLT